ncbi:hypothetical protein LguiB_030399 [Lonicera macranthoides]
MTLYCYCGRVAIVKTSKTPQNPGRRFITCPEQIGCEFFLWEDMYLWITQGGRVKRGIPKKVWVVLIVCVVILWFIFNSADEDGKSSTEVCSCGGGMK